MNEKSFMLSKFTQDDFQRWCKKNNKNKLKSESRKEFFNLVLNNVINKVNGKCYENNVEF